MQEMNLRIRMIVGYLPLQSIRKDYRVKSFTEEAGWILIHLSNLLQDFTNHYIWLELQEEITALFLLIGFMRLKKLGSLSWKG